MNETSYLGWMVVIVCILGLGWLLGSYLAMQRTMQWWHRIQSLQLCQEAEVIRDGLLQESLVLRRRLELSQVVLAENQEWLSLLEHFHHALEDLGDRLSPPFIQDSLPLTIRYVLESWKHHSNLSVQFDLPTDWRQESYEHSQAIIMVLNELLRLMLTDNSASTGLTVRLEQRGSRRQLSVQQVSADLPTAIINSVELEYLRRAFRVLTAGSCFCRRDNQTITWFFYW